MDNLTVEEKTQAVQHEFTHKYELLEKQKKEALNIEQAQISFWKKEAEQEILKIEAAAVGQQLVLPQGFETKEQLIIEINIRLMAHIMKLECNVNKSIDNLSEFQNKLTCELDTFLTGLAIEASQKNDTDMIECVSVSDCMMDESEGISAVSPITGNAIDFYLDNIIINNNNNNNDCAPPPAFAMNMDNTSQTSKECNNGDFVCQCKFKDLMEGDLGHSIKLECNLWQINNTLNKMENNLQYSNDIPIMSNDMKLHLMKQCEMAYKKFQHFNHIIGRAKVHPVSSQSKEIEIDNERWRETRNWSKNNCNNNNTCDKPIINNCDINGCDDEKMEEEIRIRLENARKEFAKQNENKKFPYSKKIQIQSDVYSKYGKKFGSRFGKSKSKSKSNKFANNKNNKNNNNNNSNNDNNGGFFAKRALNNNNMNNKNNNNNNNNNNSIDNDNNNSDSNGMADMAGMVDAVEIAINEESVNNNNLFDDFFD